MSNILGTGIGSIGVFINYAKHVSTHHLLKEPCDEVQEKTLYDRNDTWGNCISRRNIAAQVISFDPTVVREALAQFICGADLLIGFSEHPTF